MKKVRVKTRSQHYDVIIGHGLLDVCGSLLRTRFTPGRVAVITNATIQELHGQALQAGLQQAGFSPSFHTVPDGEQYKTLEQAGNLYAALAESQVTRTTPLIAFGGGVVGDLAGFVAATYKRGLPLVHIPTTLLAQVDSSIGGKTAIDHAGIKNSVGAFYQPSLVISAIETLQTLPQMELVNGFAEVIKYAVIADARFFRYLEENIKTVLQMDSGVQETIVTKSASLKARIVSKDEKDTGLRNLLNFGHTIGHGIESASSYKIAHGQSVALGMLLSGRIALRLGFFSKNALARLKHLIGASGLMTRAHLPDTELIIAAIRQDKKIRNGRLRFVLPRTLGRAFITEQVDLQMIKEALENNYD